MDGKGNGGSVGTNGEHLPQNKLTSNRYGINANNHKKMNAQKAILRK
jgi:hypothetical protein